MESYTGEARGLMQQAFVALLGAALGAALVFFGFWAHLLQGSM